MTGVNVDPGAAGAQEGPEHCGARLDSSVRSDA